METPDAQPDTPGQETPAPTEQSEPASQEPASDKPKNDASRVPARLRPILNYLLHPYPELPPMPTGWLARIMFGLTILAACTFVAFFSAYLFALHDAYLTHAEDLGIMDQALWTTTHGAILHQTICNAVSDTNCFGDISRFAIHFEPILLPLSLLYALIPSPKTLQFVQALVVASGALPAYWLAGRRLRSPIAGFVFALVYLLFPALQAAVVDDFHAVTLSAAFLMFAFYFMLARNDVGLFVACLLALSTKEEIPLDVIMIGLSVALLQRRRRAGWSLVALSVVWLGIAYLTMSLVSPTGHPALAGRYSDFLHHPLSVLGHNVFSQSGLFYFQTLLSPVGYLALFSPLTVLIAIPAMAINLLSSDPSMRIGIYQYNAEIVPTLVFAAIEGVALLTVAGQWVLKNAIHDLVGMGGRAEAAATWLRAQPLGRWVMLALVVYALYFGMYEQQTRGYLPTVRGFTWPQVTAHALEANSIIAQIPQSASVSAQSDLVPHLSERRYVYMFPDGDDSADYIFLDVTGNLYPLATTPTVYYGEVYRLLGGSQYHVIVARDGYLLLKRGAGPPLNPHDINGLPASFYSFTQTHETPPHPLAVRFGSSLELVGYSVSPASTLYLNAPYLTITTYWRVTATPGNYYPQLVLTRQDGSQYIANGFPATQFLPMGLWRPGYTYVVRSEPLLMTSREVGTLRLGVGVIIAPILDNQPRYVPASLGGNPGAGAQPPYLLDNNTIAVFAGEQVVG